VVNPLLIHKPATKLKRIAGRLVNKATPGRIIAVLNEFEALVAAELFVTVEEAKEKAGSKRARRVGGDTTPQSSPSPSRGESRGGSRGENPGGGSRGESRSSYYAGQWLPSRSPAGGQNEGRPSDWSPPSRREESSGSRGGVRRVMVGAGRDARVEDLGKGVATFAAEFGLKVTLSDLLHTRSTGWFKMNDTRALDKRYVNWREIGVNGALIFLSRECGIRPHVQHPVPPEPEPFPVYRAPSPETSELIKRLHFGSHRTTPLCSPQTSETGSFAGDSRPSSVQSEGEIGRLAELENGFSKIDPGTEGVKQMKDVIRMYLEEAALADAMRKPLKPPPEDHFPLAEESCSHCGEKLAKGAKFCNICGTANPRSALPGAVEEAESEGETLER
jgi:hypothetical protein